MTVKLHQGEKEIQQGIGDQELQMTVRLHQGDTAKKRRSRAADDRET